MINLKRILMPTDFSDASAVAVDYACVLAERFDCELYLLHVLRDLVAEIPEPGLAFPLPEQFMQRMREEAESQLSSMRASMSTAAARYHEIRQGTPFVEIIRYARSREIDLIVMGTHGRSGLRHALLGSVAERVVRKAPCPVLTIHPDDHQFVMP